MIIFAGMINKKIYTHNEEVANIISHIIGGFVALVAGIILLVESVGHGNNLAVLSMCLYLFGVISSYVTSVVYHICPVSHEIERARLRKFDHAAIYWHIAGCYSPVALIAMLQGGAVVWGWIIFSFIWVCAIVGTSLSFRKMSVHSYIETVFYVLMGLTILVAFKPFYDCVGMPVVGWVIAEGICYIEGAVLYSIHKVRYMHALFHVFIVLGDIFHIIAVWKILCIFGYI